MPTNRSNIDKPRMIRLAIAGAAAGFIIFLICNPEASRREGLLNQLILKMLGMGGGDPFKIFEHLRETFLEMTKFNLLEALLIPAGLSALIGGFVILTDEWGSSAKRILIKVGTAVACGAVIGGCLGGLAEYVSASTLRQMIEQLFPRSTDGSIPIPHISPLGAIGDVIVLVIMGVIGWMVMGFGAGAGIGIAVGSRKRAKTCMLGGLLGGLAGVVIFNIIGQVTGSGMLSRFIGLTVFGAVIGAAVAIAEDKAKRNWVVVLAGPKEGRSFIISKPVTSIGRDELADIPLFGDPGIAKQHVFLHLQGYAVTLESAPGAIVTVNSVQTSDIELKDSDVIIIGNTPLRYHQKSAKRYGKFSPSQPPVSYSYPQSPYSPHQNPVQTISMSTPPSAGMLTLNVVAGPYMGHSTQFAPGTVRIGREAGYEINLEMDTRVSRTHAEIGWNGSSWLIRDTGSTNGVYVNGARVTSQALYPGDQIGIGQTVMTVDGV